MNNEYTLNSDWISPPGKTLEDFIDEQGETVHNFAKYIKCKVNFLNRLLNGQESIDSDLAEKLEILTGASQDFWLTREKQYRNNIERIKKKEESESKWLSELPTADMIKLGWIDKVINKKEKVLACLNYFNVRSLDEWNSKYEGMMYETAFRTSPVYSSKTESVAAWLRQGEILSENQMCNNWNKDKLIEIIPEIRKLTNIPSQNIFIPEIKALLNHCGVSFNVIRAPKGCNASGAAYWINNQTPVVILSLRYLSDDHFWFTLFHELGHLILHSDHSLILESSDIEDSEIEKEANFFSERILVPEEYQAELLNLNSKDLRAILKFSKKIGISKGIIVGQMQHKRVIPRNYLNKLKVRYTWS